MMMRRRARSARCLECSADVLLMERSSRCRCRAEHSSTINNKATLVAGKCRWHVAGRGVEPRVLRLLSLLSYSAPTAPPPGRRSADARTPGQKGHLGFNSSQPGSGTCRQPRKLGRSHLPRASTFRQLHLGATHTLPSPTRPGRLLVRGCAQCAAPRAADPCPRWPCALIHPLSSQPAVLSPRALGRRLPAAAGQSPARKKARRHPPGEWLRSSLSCPISRRATPFFTSCAPQPHQKSQPRSSAPPPPLLAGVN